MSAAANIGAFRDRTNLFISYRSSYTHQPAKRSRQVGPGNGRFSDNADPDSERAGLMSNVESDGDAVIEMDLLPPRWLDIQDEVAQYLAEIATRMKRLEQMHAKHVLPGFDDESVKAKEEREIEAVTQDITKGFLACQRAIKRVDKLLADHIQQAAGHVSSADQTMAKNLKQSLAVRVGEVSTLFRKKQAAYLKKLRSLGGGGTASPLDRSGTPLVQNPYTDPAMMESESDRSSAQSTLLQTAQVRRRTGAMDAQIEQREREIESIAQGVIDLSNLFQDLQTMVIDQGTVLDRIDYNVERTHVQVKEADKELKTATNYQKRSTKRKIIFLLFLIVAGLLILLLVKPRRSAGSGDAPAPAPGTPEAAPPFVGTESSANRHVVDRSLGDGPGRRRSQWKRRRRDRLDRDRRRSAFEYSSLYEY